MSDVIKVSCWQIDDYTSRTSEDLAVDIVQPKALQKMTKAEFLTQVVTAGGVQSELSQTYKFTEYQRDLDKQLAAGSLPNVQLLAGIAPELVTMTTPTTDAIATVIGNNSLRLIDVIAIERGETAPATVTATDVDEALGR